MLSTINAEWQLYLYYSFILGIAQSLFRVNIPTTVAAWFRRKLGLAVGIQQSAGGMGGSILAPALALLLAATDWQTAFWIIPAVGGTIVFSLVFLFHGDPADRGKRPYGATDNDPPPAPRGDPAVAKIRSQVFLRHARRTRAFWNLIAIHHLGCIGHSIVMLGVVVYATEVGVTLQDASWIVSLYSLSSVVSRFGTPILADMWGGKWAMTLAYSVQGLTVALLFWAHDPWQFYVFAVLFGLGLGGEMSALPGGQPPVLRHGSGQDRLWVPEHGVRRGHGARGPAGGGNRGLFRHIQRGMAYIAGHQPGRRSLHPVAGTHGAGVDPQLGGLVARRGPHPGAYSLRLVAKGHLWLNLGNCILDFVSEGWGSSGNQARE